MSYFIIIISLEAATASTVIVLTVLVLYNNIINPLHFDHNQTY